MGKIHLNRDRQSLGEFTPEEVAAGLKGGKFLPTDLAWREGMDTWQPLSAFTDLPEPEAEDDVDSAPPMMAPGSEILEPVAATVPTPPWEEDRPFLSKLLETIQKVLLSPAEAFSNIPAEGNVGRSIAFMIIVAWPSILIALGYQMIFQAVAPQAQAETELSAEFMLGYSIGAAIFAPAIMLAGSFFSAGIFHLILMIFGAANRSFWVTYRVVAYVNGATAVLLLVPFCGGMAQGLWAIVAMIFGIKEAQKTTTTNAVVTVLLPGALCCGLILLFVSLAIGAGSWAAANQ